MYGKKKFRPISKPIEQVPVVNNSNPTFICGKCKALRVTNNSFSELSLLENSKLICYTKLCGPCTELLKTWIKG